MVHVRRFQEPAMRIGFLGLGNMGSAMAANLGFWAVQTGYVGNTLDRARW
jgi:3-hydroxyisobutyrate dehydrogenase-like beta-hydroxyacid dehydrogenase